MNHKYCYHWYNLCSPAISAYLLGLFKPNYLTVVRAGVRSSGSSPSKLLSDLKPSLKFSQAGPSRVSTPVNRSPSWVFSLVKPSPFWVSTPINPNPSRVSSLVKFSLKFMSSLRSTETNSSQVSSLVKSILKTHLQSLSADKTGVFIRSSKSVGLWMLIMKRPHHLNNFFWRLLMLFLFYIAEAKSN